MPQIETIRKVLVLGSGPIVIGQGCEFDYSGTQACRVLKEKNIEVILVNSNPATIMTDPETASKVYIEPLDIDHIEKVIEKEKPDSLIATLGGQTALNLALELEKKKILKKHNVKLLGATPDIIDRAEDRKRFNELLTSIGAQSANSLLVNNLQDGVKWSKENGFPIILRPNFTLGGSGGSVVYSESEFEAKISQALMESPTSEVLVEESLLGWREYEMEIIRDNLGSFIVVCCIENIDPCGVHTGDSVAIAPQQTLSDRQYQQMRLESLEIAKSLGLRGGANIQFAVHPETGRRVVIEMNPRVSRSSALASKATGVPIAKISALIALGYNLHEIQNQITGKTPSCYEPALDYIAIKVPYFQFQKFPKVRDELTVQMKSLGEALALGRTFQEAFQKAFVSLEASKEAFPPLEEDVLHPKFLSMPNSKRYYYIMEAFRMGWDLDKVYRLTKITPWFLEQMQDLALFEKKLSKEGISQKETLLKAKRKGFSDFAIGRICKLEESKVTSVRRKNKIHPSYLLVDTCAAEFEASSPYYYSSYWSELNTQKNSLENKNMAVLLGSGPNRIGQGIEFDYSCARSISFFQKQGTPVAVINSNPSTVSTDYDLPDQLFIEPLADEYVQEVLTYLKPKGVVTQFAGQTGVKIMEGLVSSKFPVPILGSSWKTVQTAEDRKLFFKICSTLDFKIPESASFSSKDKALEFCNEVGYPVICRPSYVLGGSKMMLVENEKELTSYFEKNTFTKASPCQVDRFLASCLELDVDLVRGKDFHLFGGIFEHIEAAGIHSGDSMGVIPPQRLKQELRQKLKDMSLALADRLEVIGFLNIQVAVKGDEIYILEANTRSSRSLPFIAKATGRPLVRAAVQAFLTQPLDWSEDKAWDDPAHLICVKGVIFPFKKFAGMDSIMGPEMRSTGESMGRGQFYTQALVKAFVSVGSEKIFASLEDPEKSIFVSLKNSDKEKLGGAIKSLAGLGYKIIATEGTAQALRQQGLKNCEVIQKVHEGRPNCADLVASGKVSFVVNTPSGRQSLSSGFYIRRSCMDTGTPLISESSVLEELTQALVKLKQDTLVTKVRSL